MEHLIQESSKVAKAAEIAANVIATAAETAIKTLANAASSAQSIVNLDLGYMKSDIAAIKLMLENKYVTKEAFGPVKIITYGMTAIALSGVVYAIVALVVVHK